MQSVCAFAAVRRLILSKPVKMGLASGRGRGLGNPVVYGAFQLVKAAA
jgi:hypothetical protein